MQECKWCGRSFKRIQKHLSHSDSCQIQEYREMANRYEEWAKDPKLSTQKGFLLDKSSMHRRWADDIEKKGAKNV